MSENTNPQESLTFGPPRTGKGSFAAVSGVVDPFGAVRPLNAAFWGAARTSSSISVWVGRQS